jgi:hypothetical protein
MGKPAEPIPPEIQQLLGRYCLDCHDAGTEKGDLNLERFTSITDIAADSGVWENVLHQIEDGEMPPKKKPQFTADERERFTAWVQETLDAIALANAGDPGPVVLRRLSNHEYTYTIRDLTGVESLDPAREFPVDGAAGEGFTNVGSALVMSPGLLTKYLDAAKEVASHAVILPDRIEFSPSDSRADWTNEKLAAIRDFHLRHAHPSGRAPAYGTTVKDVPERTVIPLEAYLRALKTGKRNGLSQKYLATLEAALQSDEPSALLDPIRERFREAKPNEVAEIANMIRQWQGALFYFSKVGHIGKRDAPKRWQLATTPVASLQTVKFKLPEHRDGRTITIYLAAGEAGDGPQGEGDAIVWRQPRLMFQNRAPIPLSQLGSLLEEAQAKLDRELARTAAYLEIVKLAYQNGQSLEELASKRSLDPELATNWMQLLKLGDAGLKPSGHFTDRMNKVGGWEALKGWRRGNGLPSLLVNQSEDAISHVTFTVPGRAVTVHPAPDIDSIVFWQSPIDGEVTVDGLIADADGACGNGAAWKVEKLRAAGPDTIANGQFSNGGRSEFSGKTLVVSRGELIRLTVMPIDRNHSCDTTQISLTITENRDGGEVWDLAGDIVDRIHESNPLGVWHFADSKAKESGPAIPPDSELGKWRTAILNGEPADAQTVQAVLLQPATDADRQVRHRVTDLQGEFRWLPQDAGEAEDIEQVAPMTLEFPVPDSLAFGAEFEASVELHPDKATNETTAQAYASVIAPPHPLPLSFGQLKPLGAGKGKAWTAAGPPMSPERPILVREGGAAETRVLAEIAEFQSLFPAALTYTQIVPVDEVVTLTLFHREDEELSRLMLDDRQAAGLDRLWDELRFVRREPLRLSDAYDQLWQFATQDADPSAFEPMREPIKTRAAAFEKRLVAVEPNQVAAIVEFAERAWRRPLSEGEHAELAALYDALRKQDLAHEDALRQLLARVFVSPAFLYRGENAAPGSDPAPISEWELATRLSYFLWSSTPDAELLASAAAGELRDPKALAVQSRRMLADPKVRRLATEFGAQWLHVRDLAMLDEKSERHFPTFADLRDDVQEETVLFFVDLFQNDRSVLSLLDADYSFVNKPLAEHYGFKVDGDNWRRVDGMRERGRGGILGLAATLAKHSGASRTSPILRGNWVYEVLLGEKLSKPPKDVPVLPDEAPEGLTERQLIEKHSSDPACARCHAKVDPLGFALEGFDAIGRARGGADTTAKLEDGTQFAGIDGLRAYLLETRRDDFVRQFCRKLLGYALGRSVQLSDQQLLNEMQAALEANGYRVQSAIELIVQSPQFRNVRGHDSNN